MRGLAVLGLLVAAVGCRRVGRGHEAKPTGAMVRPDAGSEPPDRLVGVPIVLADHMDFPIGLALDQDSVYVANSGKLHIASGSIMKLPKLGGDPVVLADFEAAPVPLGVDPDSVYWARITDGAIRKVAKGGGAPQTLLASTGYPRIAVAADALYYTDQAPGTIARLDKITGARTLIATQPGRPHELTALGEDLYWLAAAQPPATAAIMRWHGGQVTTLVDDLNEPKWLIGDRDDLFTLVQARGPASGSGNAAPATELLRIPRAGGSPQVLVHGQYFVSPIAADRTHIYLVRRVALTGPGILERVPKRGGQVEVVAGGVSGVTTIAVDASGVYFIVNPMLEDLSGALLRVAKAPH